MKWEFLHSAMTMDHLGLIPDMLSEYDERPAKEQLDTGYMHGGGWRPFKGFKMRKDKALIYPNDPPMMPLALTNLRNEVIIFYQHSWVAIVQLDGSFEVCRMD
jgi:hypothetical protein